MAKKLAQRVFAGGQWWEAGDEPPEAVARTIRNPRLWSTDGDDAEQEPAPRRRAGTGPRLAARVQVDGTWYGPDSEDILDEVVARIRNPKAWEGGVLPTTTATGERSGAGAERTAGPAATTDTGSDDDQAAATAEAETQTERVPAPPRAGRGSGRDAWEAFLRASGHDVDPNATRDDLIVAAEQAGLVDKE